MIFIFPFVIVVKYRQTEFAFVKKNRQRNFGRKMSIKKNIKPSQVFILLCVLKRKRRSRKKELFTFSLWVLLNERDSWRLLMRNRLQPNVNLR